ncbi:MAG: site-2 protease family protein [Bryobacteraceae bacterium]|nr:site-2 protease family protein [Bryobacteraceae bacterium]
MRVFSSLTDAARILIVVLLLLPLAAVFLLPSGSYAGLFWFWTFGLLLMLLLLFTVGAPRESAVGGGSSAAPSEPPPAPVEQVLEIQQVAAAPAGVRLYTGRLRAQAETAFHQLRRSLPSGVIPLMTDQGRGLTTIALLPRPVEEAALEKPVRPWLHWLLFGLTFLTTTYAGAAHQGVNLFRNPAAFAVGLPYSVALLAILGFHEMGHYFMARRHGMRVTPPYFIPVPFALGTFGAFIQMRSPSENRRNLFDVAVAGPLAGLVIAIPALYFGLKTSEIVPVSAITPELGAAMSRSSILMSLVIDWSLGGVIQPGDSLRLSPMAFAGWLGLLVTALNLVPVGQLDGGHIARAMFGTRVGGVISSLAMFSLLLLAIFVWPGLLMWAFIVFFIAGRGTPPLNDVSRIGPSRLLLGAFAFLILALILIPMPENLPRMGSLRCPYL